MPWIASALAGGWIATHACSPAVRSWDRSSLPLRRADELSYRIGGPRESATGIALFHGLVSSGDVFGTTPDALARDHRVVVPDLLGFGRSLATTRTDFSTTAHTDALRTLIEREIPGDRPLRIGAHSMGCALALRFAATYSGRVERVVCLGTPAWTGERDARDGLDRLGPMAASLVLDQKVARSICSLNCRHRTLAGVVAAAIAPRWPVPIARQASLHTWDAYITTLEDQVLAVPW